MSGRRLGRGLTIFLLVTLALLYLGIPTAAHAYLESSTPEPGGDVPEGTSVLALRFTEQLDPSHVSVHLENGTGGTVDAESKVPESRPAEVRVLTDPLPEGVYHLSWRVLSVDGHVEEGSMGFNVGGQEEAAGLTDRSGDPPDLGDVLDGAARSVFLAGVLVTIGLPLFTSEVARIEGIPRKVPYTLAGFLAASLLGLLALWGLLARSLGSGPLGPLASRPGGFLIAKAGLTLLALGLVLAALRRPPHDRSTPLFLALLPASLAVIVNSMGGHGVVAFASREAVAGHVARTLHVLITGLWAGGILGFLLLRRDGTRATSEMVRRFFPIGVVSVAVLGATGLYQAYVHLSRLSDLWTSPYGWILLAKTGLLASLMGAGAIHQRWLKPRLHQGDTSSLGRFRRLVGSELFAMGLAVGLAGVLAATPLPELPGSDGPGPAATFEQEESTRDFHVRLAIDADAVQTGQEHTINLELRPRTSIGPDEATVNLTAHPPKQGDPRTLELQRSSHEAWTADGVVFEDEGTWTLTATIETPAGTQDARFEVPVRSPNA